MIGNMLVLLISAKKIGVVIGARSAKNKKWLRIRPNVNLGKKMKIPIYNSLEDKWMYRVESEAYDDNRWYDIVVSIRDRTMTRDIHKQLRSSLRQCLRKIRQLKDGSHPIFNSMLI